jgi:lysophospholipase L1-like esterase
MKNAQLLILIFLIGTLSLAAQEPNDIYPFEAKIKYHSDWTKNHYLVRLNEFSSDPAKNGDIIFIGDSITEGGKAWSSRFDRNNIKNRGISGDVTDGVIARLGEIFYFKPKAVFIMIGVNDLFNLHYKKEIPSPEYVGNNVLSIIEQINEKSPETKVYLQTLLPTHEDFMNENILKVNTMLKQQKGEFNYMLIDLNASFKNEKGFLKIEFTYDGVHLNEHGYKHWVEILRPMISSI